MSSKIFQPQVVLQNQTKSHPTLIANPYMDEVLISLLLLTSFNPFYHSFISAIVCVGLV